MCYKHENVEEILEKKKLTLEKIQEARRMLEDYNGRHKNLRSLSNTPTGDRRFVRIL